MKLYYSNYRELASPEVEKLPRMHRLAFAAACCERLLPTYNAFSRIENWGNPSLLRKALDEVWEVLQGKSVGAAKISELKDDIFKRAEELYPDEDSDRWLRPEYIMEAQDVVDAILIVLKACLEPSVEHVVDVGKHASITVELFITNTDEYDKVRYDIEKETNMRTNHPLLIRELAKQSEDLQRLQETPTLDREILEWLRTSFDNDGKSNVDLG